MEVQSSMKSNMQKVYKKLEKNIIRYQDLKNVIVKENNEPFVVLDQDSIPNGYLPTMSDMKTLTGERVLIRKSLYAKLKKAQQQLKKGYPFYTLFVTYGYRSLEIQTKKFLEQLRATYNFFENPLDLYEEVHRFIAVPIVAGHPTGGAIDIVIKDQRNNQVLNFGSEQYNYITKDCYTFVSSISKEAQSNRMLLRQLLMNVGFAPFDGEWWHFSYGDREWAFYYKQPNAFYSQINYSSIKKSV